MEDKIFTIVEGEVASDKWEILKEKYENIKKDSLPSAVLSSFLVQDKNNPEIWRITTVWESLEAITEYRKSVETPAWLLIFQEVGADPKLIINNIISVK